MVQQLKLGNLQMNCDEIVNRDTALPTPERQIMFLVVIVFFVSFVFVVFFFYIFSQFSRMKFASFRLFCLAKSTV